MRKSLVLLGAGWLLAGCTGAGRAQPQPPASPAHPVEITDSGGPLMPEQAAYDVTFYDLELAIRPEARAIEGALTATARVVRPLRSFVLDLDTLLSISAVTQVVGGTMAGELSFQRRGGKLWIDLGQEYRPGDQVSVRVAYGGKPREAVNPPWGGGFTWTQTPGGAPWIATSLQGEGADLWWPCKDHPSDEPDSMAMRFTVPADLVVASNGQLRGVTDEGGTKTYHWFVSTPVNNYAVALNAAPYRTVDTTYTSVTGEQVPATFWVIPEAEQDARRLMPQILRHLAFFEKYLGPYPFRADKYGVAHTPFLGMEHQTIIAYGSNFSDAPYGYDWLHHHELAHEWWGNLVTARDWKDFWIHEGLGTYMQALYSEELFGQAGYREAIQEYAGNLQNAMPLAPRETMTTDDIYFITGQDGGVPNNDIYYKGAAVLHTLRYLIGDEPFFRLLRRFAYPTPEMERIKDGHQTRLVDTEDFVRMAEEISGRELDWFFEVYLRQPALPELVQERTASGVRLTWRTPDDRPFPMPVAVRIGEQTRRVEMPAGTILVAGEGPIEVDPEGWVLRR